MLWFMLMIHSEPPTTSITISTPKASASTLLMLSGPVVMCRKNTRCTPICAIASTDQRDRNARLPRPACVRAMQNDTTVSSVASARPIR